MSFIGRYSARLRTSSRGKSLLVVPCGPLTQLPFQVLVTQQPKDSGYKSAAWLARDHALTVLPAVPSPKSAAARGARELAKKPMIGFGNPLLDGNQADPNMARISKSARRSPARSKAARRRLPERPCSAWPRSSACAAASPRWRFAVSPMLTFKMRNCRCPRRATALRSRARSECRSGRDAAWRARNRARGEGLERKRRAGSRCTGILRRMACWPGNWTPRPSPA